MKHLAKPLTVLAIVVSTLSVATAGWAFWTSIGTGSASASVGTLSAPTGVSASWSGTTGKVTVGWNAVASPDGEGSHVGYSVQRDAITVCGSPTLLTSTTTTCNDSDVPRGGHTYTVTAVFRTWTASTSTTTPVAVAPNVAIAGGQSVPTGGTISAALHGFQASDTITFKLDTASGTAITSPVSVSTPAGSGSAIATLTIPAGASAGTHTIYASGLGGAADSATSTNTFTVPSAAATQLVVSGFPSPVVAGTQSGFTVTAKDASNNVITGYRGTVTFSTNDPLVTSTAMGLPSNYTFVAADNGTHTFPAANGFTLKTAAVGTRTITATDTVTATITGTQSAITVTPAAAASLTLAAASTTPTAGAADNLSVTAKDPYGNTATGYTGDKNLTFGGASSIGVNNPTVSSKTGVATNFGTPTTITFTSGVASVSGSSNGVLRLYKAETASITVGDGAISNGAGLSVTVNAATASQMQLSQCLVNGDSVTCSAAISNLGNGPSTMKANIDILDAYGNIPPATSVAITFTNSNTSRFTIAPAGGVSITGSGSPTNRSGQFTVTFSGTSSATTTIRAQATGFNDLIFTVSK